MDKQEIKNHWENIYGTKAHEEVGWYQQIPLISLSFFDELKVSKDAHIIDVGGGESFLVDNLTNQGYQNISVLDIASKALEKSKTRLGPLSQNITWITANILDFSPAQTFDVWHDRAVFHFLLEDEEVNHYVQNANRHLNKNGVLIIGTFSDQGPTKCSGLPLKRYSMNELKEVFSPNFEPIKCFNTDHLTPSGTAQNYSICSFRKKPGF